MYKKFSIQKLEGIRVCNEVTKCLIKLIFNKKKEVIMDEYDEFYETEEIELPKCEIVYSEQSKILIVSGNKNDILG